MRSSGGGVEEKIDLPSDRNNDPSEAMQAFASSVGSVCSKLMLSNSFLAECRARGRPSTYDLLGDRRKGRASHCSSGDVLNGLEDAGGIS